MTKLWQRDGRPDVACVVTWQGPLHSGVGEQASIVESATPFICPRHWRKGRDFRRFLIDEVRRECRNHSLDERSVSRFWSVCRGYSMKLNIDGTEKMIQCGQGIPCSFALRAKLPHPSRSGMALISVLVSFAPEYRPLKCDNPT